MTRFWPNQLFLSLVFAITAAASLVPRPIFASQPRVVILKTPSTKPPADNVVHILAEQLFELDLTVEPHEVDTTPTSWEEWIATGEQAASLVPGTIALIGYQCDTKICNLFIVEPRQRVFFEIPVQIPEHGELSTSFALAATARESLLGPLFPEIKRLVLQGKNPAPPPPSPDSVWLRPPAEETRRTSSLHNRPWLWLEGGYQGGHPHPEGRPVHGPWIGAVFEPRTSVGVHISAGWLGIRDRSTGVGDVTLNRLTSNISLRVIFPLGPAHIAIAPTARLDTVFVNVQPKGGKEKADVRLEIQAGGVTTWHLPLTSRVEVIVGAGVLASLLSHDYGINTGRKGDESLIPASTLRLFWLAGVAWSPL